MTSSLARRTWLTEDKDRFEARRWETSDSSGVGCCSGEGDRGERLSLDELMVN